MSGRTVTAQDVAALSAIVGAPNCLYKEAISEDYGHDELGGVCSMPEIVLRVGTTGEVSEILRYASQREIPLVVRGSGTGLVGAAVAVRRGILLDMTRMNRILELDEDNLTVTVQPGVLLMDEPLSNLDAKLRVQMRTVIKKLQRRLGITTIYVTHDQEEALAISDRIAVIKEGEVMQVGSPENIYKKPQNTFVAGFIGVSNFVECDVNGENPEAAVLDIKGECTITCSLKAPFKGEGIISARPEQLFFDEKEGLPGKIVISTFLGDFIEYEIELDNGQTVQLNEYTKDVRELRPDGQRVKVNFDINAVGVYDARNQEVISW